VLKAAEDYVLKQPEVADMVAVTGFSFSGQGQNMGLAFIPLKSWDERKDKGSDAQSLAGRITMHLGALRDSFIFVVSPPPIPELGRGAGFSFRLQDRGGLGHAALLQARNQLLGMAMQSPVLTGIRPEGLEDAPQLQLDIDRDKAQALGVTFDAINTAISTALGSAYVNDFPNAGRLQRVVVQADAKDRMQPEDLLRLNALNTKGQPVPLSAFASTHWINGPQQTTRYNGYPAMSITGEPKPGYSSGDALQEMQTLAAKLPAGFAYEWTGQSREEILSGSTVFVLIGFSLLAVFLALAALYESWSIPVSVLLVVPLGVLGSLLAASMRSMPNDVYFKVGLITVIGLAAKNAILIIEFAKDLQAQGKSPMEAALQAAHLRFRPIIMTSLAFILGVLPLVIANGAGAASQRAIGTGVMGGMITATALGVLFVPVFFVVIRSFFKGSKRQQEVASHHEDIDGAVKEKI
jgi:multidrug efflux pump